MAQACEGTLRAPVHSRLQQEMLRGGGEISCVFMWQREKVRRKGGHQIGPEELAKTFQFKRNILQAKAPGESALSICRVTGPHPSPARKSRTQPIRIHWRFWASSKPQSGQNAPQNTKSRKPFVRLHHDDILHCHPAKWKQVRTVVRLKRKNGRWHFTTQYFQKTLTDWKRWSGFSQWLDSGINNAVLLQPHIIPLLGCQNQTAVFELRDDGLVSREKGTAPWKVP